MKPWWERRPKLFALVAIPLGCAMIIFEAFYLGYLIGWSLWAHFRRK